MQRGALILGLLLFALAAAGPVAGQLDLPPALRLEGLGPAGGPDENLVSLSARFTAAPDGRSGRLFVAADIQPGWHIYSVTQKPGGPKRTAIRLDANQPARVAGEFQPDVPPRAEAEPLFDGLTVESHEGRVTWSAPLEFAPGADLRGLQLAGKVSLQVCADVCHNKTLPFVARLDGDAPATAAAGQALPPAATADTLGQPSAPAGGLAAQATGEFAASPLVTIRGSVEPRAVAPGGRFTVRLSAEPRSGWHAYALADRDPEKVEKPTLIVLQRPAGWRWSKPVADKPPVEKPSDIMPGDVVRYYEGPVEWMFEIEVPADAALGQHSLAGMIGYQVCTDRSCDSPRAALFEATLAVDASAAAGKMPLAFSKTSYSQAARAAAGGSPDITPVLPPLPAGEVRGEGGLPSISAAPAAGGSAFVVETLSRQSNSLWVVLGLSFLAGSLLNVMPCVLPVIGLKILGFVQQAGEHRLRILSLNLWYSAGLMSVFMALATLAVFLGQGWGQQFQSATFNIALMSVVWVCALSFLGVWEIPIPGFAASHKANELAMKEGPLGAFSKGVLTTLLATPCAGPLLIPQLTWALGQPPVIAYAAFGAVGLGMACPYLLIGAFPRLISWLPKPGAWMDTFKQAMGFVLLGTVAFLFSFLQQTYLVPTFILLVGLWAGCWWIGRTPLTAELGQKLVAWAVGGGLALLVGLFAFGKLDFSSPEAKLAWQPYSRERLVALLAEGKTVMVDFTADWCLTCQANKKFTFDTEATKRLLDRNGIVPLLADKTEDSPEIESILVELGNPSGAIPYLAFFSGRDPKRALVVDGVVTHGTLRKAVDRVGPSTDKGTEVAVR